MNKNLIRNLLITAALLLAAFFAKMDVINFLLALAVGIVAAVYVAGMRQTIYQKLDQAFQQASSWFSTLMCSIMLEMYRMRFYSILPTLAGLCSGFLAYFALNALFISP
jgi:Na+/pantothenate symporter